MCEQYVLWCGSKYGYQKDMCKKEIGFCAQSMITIPGSIVNIIGRDLYDHIMSTRVFISIMNKIFM
jgi:hypothetical protein